MADEGEVPVVASPIVTPPIATIMPAATVRVTRVECSSKARIAELEEKIKTLE